MNASREGPLPPPSKLLVTYGQLHGSFCYRKNSGNTSVPFHIVANGLTKFSGSSTFNVVLKISTVYEKATLYRCSDQKTLVVAKRALKDILKDWLASQGCLKSWDELRQKLRTTFKRHVTALKIYHALSRQK